MPIYEYECEACGNCFEMLVFSGGDDDAACPQCSGKDVKRLMSAATCVGLSGNKSCAPVGAGSSFS
jgi:putative FmdB family regulatory protein